MLTTLAHTQPRMPSRPPRPRAHTHPEKDARPPLRDHSTTAAPTEPRLWPGAEGPRTPSLPWPLQEGVGSTETHWGRGLSGLWVGRGWSGRGHGAWEALQGVRVGWVKEGELGTAQISLNLACQSQALPAGAPPPFKPTKGIQTRDKYLRLKIKPSPASLFRQPELLPGPHLGINWTSFRNLHVYQCGQWPATGCQAWTGPQGL